MCGISVIVALRQQQIRSTNAQIAYAINNSLDLIQHRGPDSRGHWISENGHVVLGHVRLAINDLNETGNQPLRNASGTVHAVVAGELYGHDAIRTSLSQSIGYRFCGHSDSEIVVALYERFGSPAFLSHLRGEFALCLYDSRNDYFLAARDRYGIKPLFWTVQDGQLLVASEAKAFLALGWRPEWDVKSIVEGGWNFDNRTLFKGVEKLQPGCILSCSSSADSLGHARWWDMGYPDKHVPEYRTEDEMIQGVRSLLVDAVRMRLQADAPVGVYLSGGIDSSVIAGIVAQLTAVDGEKLGTIPAGRRMTCFTVAFDEESGFDESDIARRTAKALNAHLHEANMSEAKLAAHFEDATWHSEHHNPDLNYVGKFFLSKLARESGFKVVLTGEGADEHFTGYHIYLPDYLREADYAWPSGIPESTRLRRLEESEEETAKYYASIGADGKNHVTSEARQRLNNISTLSSMAAFVPPVFASWTRELAPCDPQATIVNGVSDAALESITKKWHPLHSAQYVWIKCHLVNQFLSCLGDRTEMAHSLEGRTPLLDHHLTEYVNNLPPSLKMRWSEDDKDFTFKWVLREAGKPFITEEVYRRKKHPYSAPLNWAVDAPLHTLFRRLITKDNVLQLGFVCWQTASGLLQKAFEEHDLRAMRLVFVVAQWIVLAQRFGVATAQSIKLM